MRAVERRKQGFMFVFFFEGGVLHTVGEID